MIKYLSIILLLVIAFACSKENETPSGMKFKILREGDGIRPRVGQVMVFHYQLKDDRDSVWNDTWEEAVPAFQMITDSSNIEKEDGMRQMFRMLSIGDSAAATMSVTDFFTKLINAKVPPFVDSTRNVTYYISPKYFMSPEEYGPFRQKSINRRDSLMIIKFLEKNNLTAETDSSGLRFIRHNQTNGTKPVFGNCVDVKYTGRFLRNGKVFQSNPKASFPYDRNIISGWRTALGLMSEGDSATFFLPSKLAYGSAGSPGAIPPDAVLIFDIKLDGVQPECK